MTPEGVQGLDRYAYANNNAVKYTDPTGHIPECGPDGVYCDQNATFEERYNITFEGVWNDIDKAAVIAAVEAVASKFAILLMENPGLAWSRAFGSMTFQMGNCSGCNGSGGYTAGAHRIEFASMAENWRTDKRLRDINLVVHELGHAFDFIRDRDPSNDLYRKQLNDPKFPNRGNYPNPKPENWTGDTTGFASRQNVLTWQMSVTNAGDASEEFADQFLGWTFNTWDTNEDVNAAQQRSDWMDQNMRGFVK